FRRCEESVAPQSPSPSWGGVWGGVATALSMRYGRAMANERARALRRNQTEAERALWQKLRVLKAEGFHFRRQAPIGTYIADFACHSLKLVIEVDGGQHNEKSGL